MRNKDVSAQTLAVSYMIFEQIESMEMKPKVFCVQKKNSAFFIFILVWC